MHDIFSPRVQPRPRPCVPPDGRWLDLMSQLGHNHGCESTAIATVTGSGKCGSEALPIPPLPLPRTTAGHWLRSACAHVARAMQLQTLGGRCAQPSKSKACDCSKPVFKFQRPRLEQTCGQPSEAFTCTLMSFTSQLPCTRKLPSLARPYAPKRH